jgi:hypothetical protein
MPKHIRLHGIDHFDSSSASSAAARLFSTFGEINIMVNWFDELKRRVPKNKS